ncbi:arsenate reductase/protein-tyrosine-phosphatase family protein [Arthrobacter sp. MDT2-16]
MGTTATDARATPDTHPLRILTVCTGNICRSPLAERLLQAGLDERRPGQIVVESAGTGALVGEPIDPRVAGYIRLLGGTAENFSAKQLTPEVLARQDLVLALTRDHRKKVVEMAPAMLRKTFTLLEYARLISTADLGKAPTGHNEWLGINTRLMRLRVAPNGDGTEDDVADPYRRKDSVYQDAARLIAPAVDRIVSQF